MQICPICLKEFDNPKKFGGHLSSHHRGEKYKINRKRFIKNENHECNYCHEKFRSGQSLGAHKPLCKLNPNRSNNIEKIRISSLGRITSQETKDKLSKSMIRYLDNNPERIPYLLNHSSKQSYPEKYFKPILEQKISNIVNYYRISRYCLDFAIVESKIDIEIDGEQHFVDSKCINNDEKRNQFLLDLGWTIYRLRWSKFQRLNYNERCHIINLLVDDINAPVAQFGRAAAFRINGSVIRKLINENTANSTNSYLINNQI